MISTDRPSPIRAACERHPLAEVATRTGIHLAASSDHVNVACPFPSHQHPDRTPSLRLHLDTGRYHCFGCAAHGDVVQWVRDAEGLDVRAAIAHLDRRAPITNAWAGHPATGRPTHPPASPTGWERPDPDRTTASDARAALAAAWEHYSTPGLHHAGIDYLTTRGITIDHLEERTGRAEVGHTPTGADTLTRALLADGITADALVDAGLTLRAAGGDDRLLDAYRNRVLLPVRDPDGAIVALLGRHHGQAGPPKYLNPPRTAVYDKSRNLYQPLRPPAPAGHVIVVEGPLDALAIATTAVAANLADRYCPLTQSGRQLSAHQIRHVRHLDRHPILAFDADPAGQQSTTRIGTLLALAGCTPAVARLPRGEDPASWLARHGADGLVAFHSAAPGGRLTAPAMDERSSLHQAIGI